jgi:hypothetical protein
MRKDADASEEEGQPKASQEAEAGQDVEAPQDVGAALGETDRRLRRLLRRLDEGQDPTSEEMERELKGARRQLKVNRELLGWTPSLPGSDGSQPG